MLLNNLILWFYIEKLPSYVLNLLNQFISYCFLRVWGVFQRSEMILICKFLALKNIHRKSCCDVG